ncbi:uncharacterized protein LOC124860088 [Girardinichthys multiradiatus]|uniref:uncharacterized protein LOC124860088 n=1 Tax=Girardinichthys multiradiatus TaxID=208333 RepID=UPI001FAD685A|nr:uncharacterized protein LOC124860088 [Girardinichthys multiradiatus]
MFQNLDWLYWYKQSAGDTLKLISKLRKNTNPIYGPGFSSSSFHKTYGDKMSQMTILKTTIEDDGMYHCAHINWLESAWSATYLLLKGTTRTSNTIFIQQSVVSHSAHGAESVSLECSFLTDSGQKSCSGEPSMFWIRARSDKSYPNVIYNDGRRSHYCEKRADIQKRCIYNFFKNVSSDGDAYYCAVATCGEILFGNGNSLDFPGKYNI